MKSLNGKLIFCRLTKLVRKTTKLKSLQPKKAEIHAAIHKKKKIQKKHTVDKLQRKTFASIDTKKRAFL
jgi:hypothetical protein